jgi:PAS domain S-box-containing protein
VIGEEIAIESLKHGATDYVLKHRLQRLVPAVRRALAESREKKERYRAEAALRASEARLSLAIEVARLGLWDLDMEKGFIVCSDVCAEMLGIAPQQPVPYGELRARIHREDIGEVERKMCAALHGSESQDVEYRVIHDDKSIRWISTNGRALGASGEFLHMVGVALDITARKRVEQSLAAQAHELATLNTDLRQLAYAASHDLKEPLRMVSIYSELLMLKHQDQVSQETLFHFIKTGTSRMESMLRDLLSYIEIDPKSTRFALTDLNTVMQDVLDLLPLAIQETNAKVEVSQLPLVECSASQISQVFQNLIGNALKYRGADSPHIRVWAERHGQDWWIAVKDNGIGFAPEFAETVFGLFKRLHSSEYPGTGLGLAICKRIVERHHGRIWAESEPGQGSTFYLSLPTVFDPSLED